MVRLLNTACRERGVVFMWLVITQLLKIVNNFVIVNSGLTLEDSRFG